MEENLFLTDVEQFKAVYWNLDLNNDAAFQLII